METSTSVYVSKIEFIFENNISQPNDIKEFNKEICFTHASGLAAGLPLFLLAELFL